MTDQNSYQVLKYFLNKKIECQSSVAVAALMVSSVKDTEVKDVLPSSSIMTVYYINAFYVIY